MSDKPKTLEQAFESFEKAFTPPISLTFNEKLLVEIFWNAAIESRKEIEGELRLEIHHRDEQIESMKSELDKRDMRIKELISIYMNGLPITNVAEYGRVSEIEKMLTQGGKDE